MLAGYTGVDYSLRWPTLDLEVDLEQAHGDRVVLGDLIEATLEVDRAAGEGGGANGSSDGVRSRRRLELVRDLYLAGRRLGRVRVPDGANGSRELSVTW